MKIPASDDNGVKNPPSSLFSAAGFRAPKFLSLYTSNAGVMGSSNDFDIQESIKEIQSIIGPIKKGDFSERFGKVAIYFGSIAKSWNTYYSSLESVRQQAGGDQNQARDAKVKSLKSSTMNSIRFARMNLDQVMAQALDKLIPRPRLMTKADEVKRAGSLKIWFDKLQDPTSAMLEHYKGSSIPLDKYLIAGRWGHEYLRARRINTETYDHELCEILQCSDSAVRDVILNYGRLSRMIDALEEGANRALEKEMLAE
ncbi:MAG: hypothetical protein ACE14P_12240 [Methanotrichaceae archaeon]